MPDSRALSAFEVDQLQRLEKKWKAFAGNLKNIRKFQDEMSQRVGACIYAPQRITNLTSDEEKHRFKRTLQCQDEMYWILLSDPLRSWVSMRLTLSFFVSIYQNWFCSSAIRFRGGLKSSNVVSCMQVGRC